MAYSFISNAFVSPCLHVTERSIVFLLLLKARLAAGPLVAKSLSTPKATFKIENSWN